jgi:uncharacterized coiled-coil protein SlyX
MVPITYLPRDNVRPWRNLHSPRERGLVMITIREAAAQAGVSKDKCRYWLKLLDLEMVKQDRKLFLPDNAADLLQAMKKAVDSGLAPVAAAQDVKNIHPLPTLKEVHQDKPKNDITLDKFADLEKSIMFLAQTIEKQNNQISQQSRQIEMLSARLLPVKMPTVEPQPRQANQDNLTWYKRLWLELFAPEQLRATP